MRELKGLGANDESIAAILAVMDAQQDDDEGLWPDNMPAFQAFLVASTQWRVVAGFGFMRYEGFDYAGVAVAHDRLGIKLTPDQWRGFQEIEREASRLLNERK